MANNRHGTHVPSVRAEAEKVLGITQRSAPINFSWSGDIRKRYTDFLVNEMRKDGSAVHLEDFEEVKLEEQQPVRTPFDPQMDNGGKRPVKPFQGHMLTNRPHQRNFTSAAHLTPSTNDHTAPVIENHPPIQPISDADMVILEGLVGQNDAKKLADLDEAIQAKKPLTGENKRDFDFGPIEDRESRAKIHQEIRRIFGGRVDSTTSGTHIITAYPAKWTTTRRGNRANNSNRGNRGVSYGGPPRNDNRGRRDQGPSFAQLGGDYLHFTLYKENKDTMDAINTIARLIKVKASNFGFAGTKDRRAGTVQRVSIYRQRGANMIWLNTRLPNVKIGDFTYSKEPIQLGQHGGNEFIITIKNCHNLGDSGCSIQQRARMVQESVEFALAYVKQHGYINYFGLQRFGTHTIGTHSLGMKILNEDFEGAIDDILHVDEQFLQEVLENAPQHHGHNGHNHGRNQSQGNDFQHSRDDYARAKAITTWKLTKKADKAMELMPKRFSSEYALIRHLGRNPKDFMGAILNITRGMRMMYIHAYQSFVWNFVATRRWSKYGPSVVEGDLVLVGGRSDSDSVDSIIDVDNASEAEEDSYYAEARALTAEDVASGKYTIFDIVLPTPGYDVIYPSNDIGEYYREFMEKEENGGLSPYEMRRKNKEFSLSGNYRHLIGRFIGEPQYAIHLYSNDMEQMHPTDLDICKSMKAAEAALAKAKKAASSAHWAPLTANPVGHDDALAAERRRKASHEPEQRMVTNETWVHTGLDGGAKRVKVAREHMKVECPEEAPVLPTTTTEMSQPDLRLQDTVPSSISVHPPSAIHPPAPSSNLVVKLEGLDDPFTDAAGQPPQQLRPVSSPPSSLRMHPVNVETPYTGVIGQERAQMNSHNVKPGTDLGTDMMEIDSNLPAVIGLAAESSMADSTIPSAEAEVKEETVADEETTDPVIEMPEFRSPSENPLLSVNGGIAGSATKATKVAVVLKFQLKCSNYATIVLRELMGANAGLQA
ncbi:pseudouridine synthase [Apodospora peruviana]|uniref:Pseudouridine synthase n=1 Tax=Apodospora peruviana TaxID=516989 RepID=A0AAE0M920_9PEZI|nr:pseudouridine synthase [Apodospora peruviana]